MRISKATQYADMASENGFVEWYIDEFMPDYLAEFKASVALDELVAMLRWAHGTALDFGFTDFPSLTHFVTLMWKIGPTFHEFPGFREIAHDRKRPAPDRVEQIFAVNEDQASAAILNADDRAWFTRP